MGADNSTLTDSEPIRSSTNSQTTSLKVYVLKLVQEKYYVGKTTKVNIRLDQHFQATGSEWTKRYPPELVMEIIDNADDFDEDKIVKRYMSNYGINNVRGGSYSRLKLTSAEKQVLTKELFSAGDRCFRCGNQGHFANKCPSKVQKKKCCPRCGRNSHTIANCYAKTRADGTHI